MQQPNNTAPKNRRGKFKYKNDILFIVILLAVVMLAGLGFYCLRSEGDCVTVTLDGTLYGTYSLAEDRVVEIRTGEGGEAVNLLVIRDGRAYVERANCPDGICAAHKPIFRSGESIVCLPHGLVISVEKKTNDSLPDVVV